MAVSVRVDGSTAIVEIDNPPVNATSQKVRAGLMEALEQTGRDAGVTAVLLTCAGRTFVAGGDIREFDAAPVPPHLPDVLAAIEAATKPWIAALHGTVLGGGLELAMACHARIAAPGTRLGLPEVSLGLIPGAGGTVRLPRLVDATRALTMIAGGKPIGADEALEAGLIDRIAEGDLEAAARPFAQDAQLRRTLEQPVGAVDRDGFEAAKSAFLKKARGQISPKAAVEAVERALTLPADDALRQERAAFLELKASDQSAALRHIFFAERATLSDPRCKATPRQVSAIGVVGGGTMGAGIAAACLLAGYPVTLVERDAEAAEAGAARVRDILAQSLKRGLLSEEAHAEKSATLTVSDSYDALAGADLVIEAVFEDMSIKREVFQRLDAVTKPDAVLATNTSYLDVNAIAQSVNDPSRVIGLHFFSPAHIMKLLEIVLPDGVGDDVVATGAALARRLGKIAVLAGVCDGFIGNRIMSAYRHEADVLVEEGATPWQVDAVLRDFGFAIGIYEMQDLAGLDISWAMRKRRAEETPPGDDYVHIADRLCEEGWFGRKTGRGWYVYEDGRARVSEATLAIIDEERARKGITPRTLTDDEILSRLLGRMRAEARAVLEETIAEKPGDIDVVMVNGYGFPRWRGGPMFEAR